MAATDTVDSTGTSENTRTSGRAVIIGAGMGGILAALRLEEAGWSDIVIYEKADDLGGTWRENTYPGVACDVPAHMYTYSFAPNPTWSHSFAPGGEILEYFRAVAERNRVTDRMRFGAEVTSLRFTDGRWHITLADGSTDVADIVVAATGVLHHPAYPDIAGLEDFAGPAFHTARWDHSVDLTGKRVGIIGTGSSAVQVVADIVDEVAELHLFQRTPQWIAPIPNTPIDETERERLSNDPEALAQVRELLTQTFEAMFANAIVDISSNELAALEQLCRENLEVSVRDPELREKLRPDYRPGCKRLVVSGDFYQAIQAPNAELVTEGIERIESNGVRTVDGGIHELDVLVIATGFRVDRFMRPIEVTVDGGPTLEEAWNERPYSYLGLALPGFPNLFLLNGPNGPVGNFSLIEVAELQMDYVMQLLDSFDVMGGELICPTYEATEAFEASRVEAAKNTVWMTGCSSWYLDDRGVPASWPWPFAHFREVLSRPDLAVFGRNGES